MITILAFLLTLGVLIVIHEYGHYRTAVACGVKVLRFSVGFGQVIWRRQAGPDGTEFVLCALPLGGYVRMLDEREGPVPAADAHRSFNRQPLSRRAAIVAAGPAANLLLAVLLFAATNWIGVAEPKAVFSAPLSGTMAESSGMRSGDWVRSMSEDGVDWQDVQSMSDLRWQLTQSVLAAQPLTLQVSDTEGRNPRTLRLDLARIDASKVDAALMQTIGLGAAFSEPVLGEVKPGGAAAAAGLRAGDRVLSVDGRPLADAQALRDAIRAGPDAAQQWRVERNGQSDGAVLQITVTPRAAADSERQDRTVGRIEAFVGAPPAMVTVQHGVFEGLSRGAARTWELSVLTVQMLGRMLVGEASLRNLSGPITIADYAGQSVQQGVAPYLAFLALVSVSLGVLNLLPLPMLDGGHLVYYIFEAVTGRPVSEPWLARLQRGGIALLLMMMSVAL